MFSNADRCTTVAVAGRTEAVEGSMTIYKPSGQSCLVGDSWQASNKLTLLTLIGEKGITDDEVRRNHKRIKVVPKDDED